MNEPELHITPYTVVISLITVLAILASPQASSVVPPEVQAVLALANIILSALVTTLFVSKTAVVRRFMARRKTIKVK